MSDAALEGWTAGEFTADGTTRPTFRRGSGPAVIVVHEIPGITPAVARFAGEVVDRGFTVVMPSLVGTPGREMTTPYALASIARICVAREFTTMALGSTSPIIAWLRALARDLHAELGGPGVGVVGMCFSGGFALGMMVDDAVAAPVLSQPSLPFAVGRRRRADLNLTPADRDAVVAAPRGGCEVLGLRFTGDRMVGDRFGTLRDLLGDAFVAVELPSPSPRDHSVLTEHRDAASVARVLEFLAAKLLAA